VSQVAIDVRHVTKTFRRYHAERPWTVQEVLAKGFWHLKPVDRRAALRDVSFRVQRGRTVGISGLSRQQVLRRLDAIVAFAELEQFIDNPLRTYSTGMQMRLAFATAVHAEPEILLIDEVLSVGDLAFQRKCLERINEFKAAGCSILLVSHEASDIHDLCDEALWLSGGTIVEHGPASEVVERYVEHMGGEPPAVEPAAAPTPTAIKIAPSPAGSAKQTPLVIDERRFGSVELELTTVHLTNGDGQVVGDIASGHRLTVHIGYFAAQRVVGSLVRVRVLRADGLVCCDLTTEKSVLSVSAVHGEGRLTLAIERLDLTAGQYTVEVGWYAGQWAYAYDYRANAATFLVRGEPSSDAVMHAPHVWGLDAYGPPAGDPAPADRRRSTESTTASSR
jgi:lipopolysaccharide transport system ATP-binding protein